MTAWIKVQKQKFYTPMEFSVRDFLFDTAKMCWTVDSPGPRSGILSFFLFYFLTSSNFFLTSKSCDIFICKIFMLKQMMDTNINPAIHS